MSAMALDLNSIQTHISALNKLGENDLSQALSNEASFELRKNLRKLDLALRTPDQIVEDVIFTPLDLSVMRIGQDMGIFTLLSDNNAAPLTIQEIGSMTKVDLKLLERVLRYLVGLDAVQEIGSEGYCISKFGKALASEKATSGLRISSKVSFRAHMELPHTLAQLQYQNPPGSAKSAFQNAYNTEEHLFKWIQKHPDIQHDYNVFMTHQANSKLPWFDIFPVGEKQSVADQNPDCVTLVDVGGGLGGQIHAVQQRYPNLKGRMILQDLPFTTEKVLASAKFQQQFEVMSHDIFKPQPVKDACFYYLRHILHDWSDANSLSILSHLRDAMSPTHSRILVNDLVIADRNAGSFGPRIDMNMMSLLGALERTESQWRALIGQVPGLHVERIWKASEDNESVIEIQRLAE